MILNKFIATVREKKYYYIIAVLLIVNMVTAGFLYYRTRPDSLRHIENPHPFIDFSRNFIAQEHYLTTINPLRETIKSMANEYHGKTSIYIEYLNTGANISVNPEMYVWPASLTKVPLAMAVMNKIEDGDWELYSELVLMPGDSNSRSGDITDPLSEFPVGTSFTIEKLLEELLVHSDNTAYYILLRNLHQDDLKEVIQALGMEALFSEEGKISAKEYSRILRALYAASFLSREHSEMILEWLAQSSFHEFLSAGMPTDVIFAHKYGIDDSLNAYADSGIVYIPNRPYIISVMVQGDPNVSYQQEKKNAAAFMASVSKTVYEYFSQTSN